MKLLHNNILINCVIYSEKFTAAEFLLESLGFRLSTPMYLRHFVYDRFADLYISDKITILLFPGVKLSVCSNSANNAVQFVCLYDPKRLDMLYLHKYIN